MAIDNDNVQYRGINYWVAMVLGWVLTVVGIWGFFQSPILGIFDVGPVHNVVHLLSGIVLLAAAYVNGGAYARTANLTLGIVYVLVVLLGFFAPALLQGIMDFGYDNTTNVWAIADNWLHVGIAITLIAASFAERETETRRIAGTTR